MAGEGAESAVRRVDAERVVDERLPARRQWRDESHSAPIVGTLESWVAVVDSQCDFERVAHRVWRQVDLTGQLLQTGCLLLPGASSLLPGNLCSSVCPVYAAIEALGDQIRVLQVVETALKRRIEQLAHRAEVLAHLVYLADHVGDEPQVRIVVAGEVVDEDVARLTVPVEAAVSLIEPGRVPGDLVVEQQPGSFLKVETFRGGIGGDENPYRVVRAVERVLDPGALLLAHATVQDQDGGAVVIEFALEAFLQVIEGRLVLGEDDEPFVLSPAICRAQLLPNELEQALETSVDLGQHWRRVLHRVDAEVRKGLVDGCHFVGQ